MKNILFLMLFAFNFGYSQYLIEDNDITENSKEVGKSAISLDLNNPLEFYRLKCTNASYAQFPGGENAFKQVLLKNMQNAVNDENYSVNGTFDLILSISKTGELQNFMLKPEVRNSNILENDLRNVLKNMKTLWIPASCNGSPIDSKLRQKVNFRTDSYDI